VPKIDYTYHWSCCYRENLLEGTSPSLLAAQRSAVRALRTLIVNDTGWAEVIRPNGSRWIYVPRARVCGMRWKIHPRENLQLMGSSFCR
jgi:hypothetical protein